MLVTTRTFQFCIIVHDESPLIIRSAGRRSLTNPKPRGGWEICIGMTQMAARRLQLLGPVRVDHVQRVQIEAAECQARKRDAGKVPRFRSRRTVA